MDDPQVPVKIRVCRRLFVHKHDVLVQRGGFSPGVAVYVGRVVAVHLSVNREQITGERQLIDQHEDGNVTAAAKRLACSQRGLAKIYAGQTQHPRANLLASIVEAYEVDPGWLVTGRTSESWAADRIRAEAPREARRRLTRMAEEYGPKGMLER